MPTQVFEDALDLRIGLIEATLPNWRDRGADSPSYPYPLLTPVATEETRRFRVFILENPYLRATVVPVLGGRLISLFDKRTGKEVLPRREALRPLAGGRRGASLHEGLQLRYDVRQDRLNALGPVDVGDDDETVWLAESASPERIGFHLSIQLPADRAELILEARMFNRSLRPRPYNGGFSVSMPESEVVPLENGVAAYDAKGDAGLAFLWDDPLTWSAGGGELRVSRFSGTGSLAPRQLDTLRVRLIPLSGLGGLTGASREGGVFIGADAVRVQTTSNRTGHKLLLVTEEGQTMEAQTDLMPEHVVEIPLNGIKPRTLVVRDPAKVDVVRAERGVAHKALELPPVDSPEPWIGPDSPVWELRRATADVSQRALAHTLLGFRALAAREFAEAGEQFERTLLFNAEDHLAWWLKSLADHLRGVEGEQPELLNAHYLAPLEPALRVQALLAQGERQGNEPNPLLAPVAENPENLVEVASLLLEAGLMAEASVWIDEALRHQDLPVLHLLQAYAFSHSKMDVESSRHAELADGLAAPPFPHREIEWKAVDRVIERKP
ncbi:MAG TPA: DUF5107 domain-containing protein [Fimbriimonas sp.]